MYIPKTFEFDNLAEKIAFMKQYSFAAIITSRDNIPMATHLPFFIDDSSGKLVLSSHFARANEQARHIEGSTSLIIFSEPHAYISPVHYDKHESVPTWDYVSVHAYGTAKVLESEESKIKVLKEMIAFYDKSYIGQWNSLSDKFKTNMMKGIVAFEFEVTDLQGQKKLSQNKSVEERERIAEHLRKSEDGVENTLGRYIKNTTL
jgi:transcriptional regulator